MLRGGRLETCDPECGILETLAGPNGTDIESGGRLMDPEPKSDPEANVMLSGKLDGPAETEPDLEPEAKAMLSGRLDALETVADPEPKVILNGRTETVPEAEFREREAPEMTAEPDALVIDNGGKLAIEAEAERL